MKVISFKLGPDDFGIDIRYLKEIIPINNLKNTYVPNSPAVLKGLVNLRGIFVPVLDLGMIFNTRDKAAYIIILLLDGRTIGVATGAIGEIVDTKDSELENPPTTISKDEAKHISGIKRQNDKTLIILEPKSLLKTKA